MSIFTRLIKFTAAEDGQIYFADLGRGSTLPTQSTILTAYSSLDRIGRYPHPHKVSVAKLLAPLPDSSLPVFYTTTDLGSPEEEVHSTNKERNRLTKVFTVPLWPNGNITINVPDIENVCCEGSLVFVTSRDCIDVSESDARHCILGFCCGTDISCSDLGSEATSAHQAGKERTKRVAAMGPVLVHAEKVSFDGRLRVRTAINDEIVQDVAVRDPLLSSARILSSASRDTRIPAGTAFMVNVLSRSDLSEPSGSPLVSGDVVQVTIDQIGTIQNRLVVA